MILVEIGGVHTGFLDSVISVFVRMVFRLEFFFPQFVGIYLDRELKEFKQKGLIEDGCS